MKRKSIDFLCPCWFWLLMLLVSCAQEEGGGASLPDSMVNLAIQAVAPGMETKAEGESIPEEEKIEELRIIVVDQETGKVEYNQLRGFERPASSYQIPVKKQSKKSVYLLGNVEGLDGLNLSSYTTGSEWNDALLNDLTFSTLSAHLPFTSKRYEVEVKDENVNFVGYIVIAAVKFTFEWVNNTSSEITVKDLRISQLATQSYLLPHLEGFDWTILENEGWEDVWKNVTYSVPEADEEKDMDVVTSLTVPTGGSTSSGPHYYHESKVIVQESLLQQYMLTFNINGRSYYELIQTEEDDVLNSLIRSTHVHIKVVINKLPEGDEDVAIWAGIVPWKELEPVVGDLVPED